MLRLLITNLALSLLWPALNNDYSLGALLTGFILGFIVLAIWQPRYGRFTWETVSFTGYVLYQILESNLSLAWLIIRIVFNRQAADIRPGIVRIPLTITQDLEKTILASIITLTPGTLSLDLGHDASGQECLFVHAIDVSDPEHFRREIKEKFERRLIQIRYDLEAE